MSEPVRIGLVAEGPTDCIALEAILQVILGDAQPFIMTPLRPQKAEAVLGGTTDASQPVYTQKGWSGVHHWCQEISTAPHGADLVMHQMLILQLDVDVAGFTYQSANITPNHAWLPLPCNKPCPPASASADALIAVAKSWLLPLEPPGHWVWCCPAQNLETWAYAAHKPETAQKAKDLECYTSVGKRVHKSEKKYINTYAPALKAHWSKVQALCPLAQRFTTDAGTCLASIQAS